MTDSWGDGWQANQATITNCDGSIVVEGLTLPGGLKDRADVCLPAGYQGFRVVVDGGSCKREVGWTVSMEDGTDLASGSSPYDTFTGTCPNVNCTGQWSTCDAACTRTYSVLSEAAGPEGPACPFSDGEVSGCSDGDGQCVTSCSSSVMCLAGQYCRSGIGAIGSCEVCTNVTGECGCTDDHATNYSPSAALDDGTCDYGGELCTETGDWQCYTSAASSMAPLGGPSGHYYDLAATVGLGGTVFAGRKIVWQYVQIASQTLTTTNRFAFKFMDDELGVKPDLSITRTQVSDVNVNGRLIAVYSGKTNIAYSEFSNIAGGTGAVFYFFGQDVTMAFTSISGCSAVADDFGTGGGVVGYEGGTLKIKFVSFVANSVNNAGGALKINRAIGGVVEVESTLFSNNFAELTGGAIDVRNDVSLSVITSKFVNNQAGAESDFANSCWRASNGDCGYLTGICEKGTDTDDCSSGDHFYSMNPENLFIYDTSFYPYVVGTSDSVAINAVAGCTQHPCATGNECQYAQYSLLCVPCPAGSAGLDGIACTPCPQGTGPSADQQTCEPCGSGQYSAFGICQACEIGIVAEVNGVARAACTECPEFMSSSDGETCGCMRGFYNSSAIQPTCFPGEWNYELITDPAELNECESCADMPCLSACYGDSITLNAEFAAAVRDTPSWDDGAAVTILKCRVGEACPGGEVQGNNETSCAPGYAPPLCGKCTSTYTIGGDGTCSTCDEGEVMSGVIVGVAGFLLVVLLLKTAKLW